MIKINNLNKSFGNNKVLDNLSIEINDKEFLSIYGESGCGKSTLLNIIGLLEDYDSGSIEINGIKNIKINSKDAMLLRRNHISYIFQNYALIDDETVYNNLSISLEYKNLNKKEKKKKISNILNKVGLGDKVNSYACELSGGEHQRVAIARTLLHDTNIILADEPTGSLDEKNKTIVLDFLYEQYKNGKTVIIATHDNDIKKLSTRVIQLSK